jgi:hypothetical protein
MKLTNYLIPISISKYCIRDNLLKIETLIKIPQTIYFGLFLGSEKNLEMIEKSISRFDLEHCEKVIKYYFSNNSSEVFEESIMISKYCPINKKLIKNPIKSLNCQHIQCFDLNKFFNFFNFLNR